MPSPVKPQDFLDSIPSSSAGICEKFVKAFLRLPVLMYKLVNWMFNADGTFSDAAKTELGGGATGGTVTAALSAPTNVVASENLTNKVTIGWSPVSGAAFYKVYRSASTDSAAAVEIASPTATSYDDTGGTVGTHYFYFVSAVNAATVESAKSVGDEGFSLAASLDAETFGAGTTTKTIPAGWATINITVYGSGGAGGGSSDLPKPVGTSPSFYGGSGGGGGEKRVITGVAVTVGQVLTISGGAVATCGGNNVAGNSGFPSEVFLDAALIIRALGGGGGGRGTFSMGAAGAGGTGGSGGSTTTGNIGNVPTVPQFNTNPNGGSGAAGLDGYGGGGAGASSMQVGTSGSPGTIIITPFA